MSQHARHQKTERRNTSRHFFWFPRKNEYSPSTLQQEQLRHQNSFRENSEKRRAMTLSNWNLLPGKSILFEKLARLKKKSQHDSATKPLFNSPDAPDFYEREDEPQDDPLIVVCDFCTTTEKKDQQLTTDSRESSKEPDWLSVEKSVRFSLPDSKKHSRSRLPESQKNCEPERREFYPRRETKNSFCEFHPQVHFDGQQMRRNHSFGEGLNDQRYQFYSRDSGCCSCCYKPPPMVMTCCGVPNHCHQNFFDERFLHFHPQQTFCSCCAGNTHPQFENACHVGGDSFWTREERCIGQRDLHRKNSRSFTNLTQPESANQQRASKIDELSKNPEMDLIGSSFTLPRMSHSNQKSSQKVSDIRSATLDRNRKPKSDPTSLLAAKSLEKISTARDATVTRVSTETKKLESGESDPGYESDSVTKKNLQKVLENIQPSHKEMNVTANLHTNCDRRDKTRISINRSSHVSKSTMIQVPGPTVVDVQDGGVNNLGQAQVQKKRQENIITMEIISPVRLNQNEVSSSEVLRDAFKNAEASYPRTSYDLVVGLVKRKDGNRGQTGSDVIKSKLSGDINRIISKDESLHELNRRYLALKKILAKIPEDITNRKTFLETIKDVASAIKKFLDSVTEASNTLSISFELRELEMKKREFVKYSKRFSITLKEFFKEGSASAVLITTSQLNFQLNEMMSIVRSCHRIQTHR